MTPNKVAVTGHTSGIGKAIYDHYSNICEVVGYDLSNGYNLNTDVNIVLSESRTCDLFINNVWDQQFDVAQKWAKLHKNHKYTLVNIGSSVTDPAVVGQLLDKYPELEMYVNAKKLLNHTSTMINVESPCARSIIINPGFVDTEFVPGWEQEIAKHFPASTFVRDFNLLKEKSALQTTDQIVRAIEYALADTSGYVTEISLNNPFHILAL